MDSSILPCLSISIIILSTSFLICRRIRRDTYLIGEESFTLITYFPDLQFLTITSWENTSQNSFRKLTKFSFSRFPKQRELSSKSVIKFNGTPATALLSTRAHLKSVSISETDPMKMQSKIFCKLSNLIKSTPRTQLSFISAIGISTQYFASRLLLWFCIWLELVPPWDI